MNARTQALLWDFGIWFGVGFVLVAVPLLESTIAAGPDAFDPRGFLWALLGAAVAGIAGAVRKLLAPQLVSIGQTEPGAQPSIVGVSLRNVTPAPAQVDVVQQQPPSVDTLDQIGATKVDP